MNTLKQEKKLMILSLLVEGNSIRSKEIKKLRICSCFTRFLL
jgi:hypothetical protein